MTTDERLKEIAERLYQGIVTPGRTLRKVNGAHREFIAAALTQARDLGREDRDKEWRSEGAIERARLRAFNAGREEERKALLRLDKSWDLRSIVRKLTDSTAHLLAEHDCDALGHEERRGAMLAAEEWLAALDARSSQDPSPGKAAPTDLAPDGVSGVAPESPVCPCCGYKRENRRQGSEKPTR